MTNAAQILRGLVESYSGSADSLKDVFFTPLDLNRALRIEEATVQIQTSLGSNTDLRIAKPGAGSVSFADNEFTVSTTATGSDTQAFETNVFNYQPGLPGAAGMYLQKDADPVGFMDAGVGGDVFNNELHWRWTSDGTPEFIRNRIGTQATIPQSDWGKEIDKKDVTDENGDVVGQVTGNDPLDGSGDSGIDASTPFVGMVGVDVVLYGGGGFAPWFINLTDDERVEKTYAFVFSPLNESILGQLNLPVFNRLDNDGTATADDLITKDLQFTVYGSADPDTRRTPHIIQSASTVSSPTALAGFRRKSTDTGTRTSILDINGIVDNTTRLYILVNPTVTNNPTWKRPVRDTAGNQVTDAETNIQVSDDIQVDASTGIAFDSTVFEGGTGQNKSVEGGQFGTATFLRQRPLVLMAEPFGGNNPSDFDLTTNTLEGF